MNHQPEDQHILQIDAPDSTRPHLTCADPRGAMKVNNDFTIVGAIDNRSVFNAATGENTPMNF